jgi:DNA polymerase elongation subunit (family B)
VLMEERKRIRREMKKISDPFVLASMDAAQLTCKVLQNSCYGFLGSLMAQIVCTAIAASVCAIAAWMNQTCRDKIAERGFLIPYGDTDSTACCIGAPRPGMTTEELHAYFYGVGMELEKELSALFPDPNVFELEAMKTPHLIPSDKKKTYAGIEYGIGKGGFKPGHALFKGLGFIKRDRCKFAQEHGKKLCSIVLYGSDDAQQEILQVGRAAIGLFDNSCIETMDALMPFVITTAFTNNYKTESALGLVLANLITRECGKAPMLGSRLPYVVVEDQSKLKIVDRLCTVQCFLADDNKRLDPAYYLKQLTNVFKQVLQLPQHVSVWMQLAKDAEQRCGQLCCESRKLTC